MPTNDTNILGPNTTAASSPLLLEAAADPSVHWWNKSALLLLISSELSNIGIVFKVLSPWLKFLQAFGSAIPWMVFIADPLIYVFKALYRVLRITARMLNIKLSDEERPHPWQTAIDMVVIAMFAVAVLCFLGIVVAAAKGIFVGWILGLSGMVMVGYVDYYHPYRQACKNYQQISMNLSLLSADLAVAKTAVQQSRRTWYLFAALLVGLTVLLLCSSAILIAPPAIIPILMIAYKVASAYLIGLAVCRFFNFLSTKINFSDCFAKCRHTLFANPNRISLPVEDSVPRVDAANLAT